MVWTTGLFLDMTSAASSTALASFGGSIDGDIVDSGVCGKGSSSMNSTTALAVST